MKRTSIKISKQHPIMTVFKVITLFLTLVLSCMMPVLSGAGLIYNRESYGGELVRVGVLLIISGAVMTVGAVLCLFRKNIPNVIAIILSAGGFALCMTMLHKLADHADKSGWSDKYTMAPISDMYRSRLMPGIIPAVMIIIIAVVQLMSYDLAQQREEKKRVKKERENAPSPSIIGEDD